MVAPDDPSQTPALSPGGHGGQLLRGSLWMLAARWSMRMIGLVSTLILARLLAPEDFGLVAMVMLAYGLLETLSYAGVDLALLRGSADTRDHYDTAWTIQILQGLFIAAVLLAASPLIAAYFAEPRVTALIGWVALRAVIDGTQNIGIVAFRKELDFAKEFRFTLYTKVASVLLVVAAAAWLRSYWALIIGYLMASIASVVISYTMHPFRPRLSFRRARELWSFSQWLMISRVGSFLNRKVDEFIVGGQAGTAAMGSYHVASDLATLPTNEVVMPIRRAMFPTLAAMEQHPTAFREAVLESFSVVAAICLFAGVALAAAAPELIAVILGSKWTGAVPIFRWLALFGAASAIVLVLEVPIWVSGRTGMSALQSWVELAAITPLAWLAVVRYGVEGAAWARVAVGLAMVPLMMALATRVVGIGFGQWFREMWRPLAAACVMGVAVERCSALEAHALLVLAIKFAVAGSVYGAALLALWVLAGRPAGMERQALAFARAHLPRRS